MVWLPATRECVHETQRGDGACPLGPQTRCSHFQHRVENTGNGLRPATSTVTIESKTLDGHLGPP